MIFGWLKQKTLEKFTAMQLKEVRDWTFRLENCEDSELGLTYAMTMHWKQFFLENENIDFHYPDLILINKPTISIELGNLIKYLQKNDASTSASGVFPWLFTMRAAGVLELRNATRLMWKNLYRGYPYHESAADDIRWAAGVKILAASNPFPPHGFSASTEKP